jgi:TolA-binding protein
MSNKVVANKPAFRFWFSVYGFTALILTIAVVVFAWLASQSRKEAGEGRTANGHIPIGQSMPADRVQELAHFQPPAYLPTPKEPAGFTQAMQKYSARDYAGAISGLRSVVSALPDFPPARFYLGVSLLLTNDRDAGIEQLRKLIAGPASPWTERARFYLAKALLAEGDRHGAQQQLDMVIALQGDMEQEARQLLAETQ